MSTQPLPAATLQVNTLGAMAARVERWARERVNPDILVDAINDAIESIWMAAQLATLSKFIKGPLQQNMLAGDTSHNLVSITDPTTPLSVAFVAGGGLPARQYTLGYTYATDSGTETLMAETATFNLAANTLVSVNPPTPAPDALGWNLYGGPDVNRLARQNPTPLPFTRGWQEVPPNGVQFAPGLPAPPTDNTTGDNIYAIARIDVTNSNGTQTNWLQSDVASAFFTQFQRAIPFSSTYQAQVYDLIDNHVIQVRPAIGQPVTTNVTYVSRPRRLQFPQSRLPLTSFPSQRFIFAQALADVLHSLDEHASGAVWDARAGQEKLAIILSIAGENWYKNNTIKPYLR